MQDLPTGHLTAAVRALMAHIDGYDLPFPDEIDAPGHFGGHNPDTLLINISQADLGAWLDSVNVDTETNDQRHHPSGEVSYVRTLFGVRLPDTGLRLTIYVLRDAPVAQPRPQLAVVS